MPGNFASVSAKRWPSMFTSACGRDNGVAMILAPDAMAQAKVSGSRAATQIGGCGVCNGFGTDVACGKRQISP